MRLQAGIFEKLSKKERAALLRELRKLGDFEEEQLPNLVERLSFVAPASGTEGPDGRSAYVFQGTIEVDAARMIAAFFAAIRMAGGEIVTDFAIDAAHPVLAGRIMSGALRLNPAHIQVELQPTSQTATAFCVWADAREGVFHQRTAEKAIRYVMAAFDMPIELRPMEAPK